MTRLSPLNWNPKEQYFTQELFGTNCDNPYSQKKGIQLNDKILQLLEALQKKPTSPIRQLAKESNIPLSTFHRIYQKIQKYLLIRGDFYPEKIDATTLLSLESGFQENSVKKLQKIILSKSQSQKIISQLLSEGIKVWQVNRITHRFSALTLQLLSKDEYPYALWGFLFREFLKGQRQAEFFPQDPFENSLLGGDKFNPFKKPEKIVEEISDLRVIDVNAKNFFPLKYTDPEVIQRVLSLHILGFTENALIAFDLGNEELFSKTTRALLELPYITLFDAWDLEKNNKTLLCWLTCGGGGVYQLQDELSLLDFTDSIRVYIE